MSWSNKLSLRQGRKNRLDRSAILSSNFSRRSVASTAPPSESINLGKLESTKVEEESDEVSPENRSLYYTAIASDSTSEEDEGSMRDVLFSAKKKFNKHKSGTPPTLLASDSEDEFIPKKVPPRRGRRSSILGRHEVVLLTSESDDESNEDVPVTPRTPVRKVEDWLISTSPIPSSPATPARIILSSSSSREQSEDEVEDRDYIKDLDFEDSEATSKNCVDILNPIFSNMSLGDMTSKAGYSLMETIREEEEEDDEEAGLDNEIKEIERSLEIEILNIKAKRLSRGVQVELSSSCSSNTSSSSDLGKFNDNASKRPSNSVSVQAELDDSSEEEDIFRKVRGARPVFSEDEDKSNEEDRGETSYRRTKKALDYSSSNSSSSEDSDKAFKDFLSSVKKKYAFQSPTDEEKIQKPIEPLHSSLSEEEDKENTQPKPKPPLSSKKKLISPYVTTKIPEIINISSDEESPIPSTSCKPGVRDITILSVFNEDKNSKYVSFLTSLSPDMDDRRRHPDAVKYVNRFESHKKELTSLLYKLFNVEAFEGKLPHDMEIEWNSRLRKTAGICTQRRKYVGSKTIDRSSKIGLSSKVLDSGDRLRDTLIHEMCHAAAWVLSGYRDGHGPVWKSWAAKAMHRFPELPIIDRCHNYQIRTKYTYKCKKCGYSIGRHSKSLDTDKKCCGYCKGRFVLLRNYNKGVNTPISSQSSSQTTPRTPNAFASFVKEHYKTHKKPGISHGDVMKTLGTMFKAAKI
ncbi:uncharacterized protein [Lepeophtheirus salmonis]|uniref:uncharacterized protein n=1 Tax=Lepeophtheirus salmonis TaxID=72036 RepID=UPI001AE15A7E|nr:acidic repeat-containing protein-like [Lepeophtheirus salmonis]